VEDIAGTNDGWGVAIMKKKASGYVNVVACRAQKGVFKGAEGLKRKKIFDRKKKVWEEPSTFKAEATTTMTTTTITTTD
jgi:hypothetical protein